MAIEELASKIDKETQERRKRYPLLDIVSNRTEIRTISEHALEYAAELYPELEAFKQSNYWEIIPRVTMELLKEVFRKLSDQRTTETGEVSYELGDFLKIGIEYGTTQDADKDGTFNPVISVKEEMKYDNETDTNNKLRTNVPVFDDINTLQELCGNVTKTLLDKYNIMINQWNAVLQLFVAFMRTTRDYLIKHRDDTDFGVEINLADVIDMSIEKYIGDSGDEYVIQIAPGQIAKLEFSKSDEKTENKA
jgi:hypothetical protein